MVSPKIKRIVKDSLRRNKMIRRIEKLKEKKKVRALMKAMKDKDSHVRIRAMHALGELRDQRAFKTLTKALRGSDNRGVAAVALGKLGDARSVEPLIDMLKEEDNQSSAVIALGYLKSETAVEPLTRLLKSSNEKLRIDIIRSLIKIGDENITDLILKIMKDEEYGFKTKVFRETKFVENKLIVNILVQELGIVNGRIRAAERLRSLRAFVDQNAINALIALLDDKDVRDTAADSLSYIGTPMAVDALIEKFIESGSESIAKSLGRIGDLRACEPIINWLFMKPVEMSRYGTGEYKSSKFDIDVASLEAALINLFFSYCNLIINALTYKKLETSTSYGHHRRWQYDENNWAVNKLCKIQTPIATNILHKVLLQKDIKMQVSYDSSEVGEHVNRKTLSFENQRQIAKEEIERRGNPPYDPSVYLDKSSWILSNKETR